MTYHFNLDRDKVIFKMNRNWYINTSKREIGLKEKPWYLVFFYWLTIRRYTMRELYIFIHNHFHSPENIKLLMPVPYPIDHDNIKKPKEVPFNYVMQNNWTITDEGLKKLIKGPLVSEHGYQLLVKVETKRKIIIRKILAVIGWLTIPGAIYTTWLLFKELFNK